MRWICGLMAVLIIAAPVGAQQPPPARVAVTKIFEKELAPTTPLVGVVDFDRSAGLSAEISGLLAEHKMIEGAVVRKGDVLVRLNTDFTRKDIAVIDQQIAQVRIKIENTQKNLKRFETLFRQDATSEKQYDDLAFELRELKVEEQTLLVTRAKKELELAKSKIRAPYDGLVVERYKDTGEWISPGVAVCRLASINRTVVKVPVSENLIRFVKSGQSVAVAIKALDREFTGKVQTIVPKVDPRTKTFELKVQIDYAQGLLQNMTATVDVPSGIKRSLKMIKRDAMVRFQGKEFIYTVKEDQAKMLPIRVVAVEGEYLGVDAPHIKAGMPVVVDGNERLRPDQAVQIVDRVGHSSAPGTAGEKGAVKN
jgi:RND family efflux transporter MFP subunit